MGGAAGGWQPQGQTALALGGWRAGRSRGWPGSQGAAGWAAGQASGDGCWWTAEHEFIFGCLPSSMAAGEIRCHILRGDLTQTLSLKQEFRCSYLIYILSIHIYIYMHT